MIPLALIRRVVDGLRDWLLAPAYAHIDRVEDNILEQLEEHVAPLRDSIADQAAIGAEFYGVKETPSA